MILGDVMIDRYLHGRVSRISPEAPVPVVQLMNATDRLGGAANVALNVRELGGDSLLFAVIGQDESADQFTGLAQREQMDISGLIREEGRRTTLKTRVISGNQHLLRMDVEDSFPLLHSSRTKLLTALGEAIETSMPDVIILQDYNKGVLDEVTIAEVIKLGNAKSIPITVDPKFSHFLLYRGITLFKPNLKELCEGLGRQVDPTPVELEKACRELHQHLNHQISLVTLSDKGIFWFDHHRGEGNLCSPIPRDIVDVCGAGDTVIAVASLALAAGWAAEEIANLANLAGGLVCEKVGVTPINKDKLLQEYLIE